MEWIKGLLYEKQNWKPFKNYMLIKLSRCTGVGYYLIGDTNPIDIESNRMSKFLLFSIVGFLAFILLTIYIVKLLARQKKLIEP
jgi:hypothetical protein